VLDVLEIDARLTLRHSTNTSTSLQLPLKSSLKYRAKNIQPAQSDHRASGG
jgi:hypothetical protein